MKCTHPQGRTPCACISCHVVLDTVASSGLNPPWQGNVPHRRSISTVVAPNQREVENFYRTHFPERCPPMSGQQTPMTPNMGGYGPSLPHYYNQPNNPNGFYHEDPIVYRNFDPVRFSPPRLDDTPPCTSGGHFDQQGAGPSREHFAPQPPTSQQSNGFPHANWDHQKSDNGWRTQKAEWNDQQKNNNWQETKPWPSFHSGDSVDKPSDAQMRSPIQSSSQTLQHQPWTRPSVENKETWSGMAQSKDAWHQQGAVNTPPVLRPQDIPTPPLMHDGFLAPHQPFMPDSNMQQQHCSAYPNAELKLEMPFNTSFTQEPPRRKYSTIQHLDVDVFSKQLNVNEDPSPSVNSTNSDYSPVPRKVSRASTNSRENTSNPHKSSLKKIEIVGRKASLMALKSHLRTPKLCEGGAAAYTPPPILSPMRNGSGLFWQIARALGQHISPLCGDNAPINGFPGVRGEMDCVDASVVINQNENDAQTTSAEGQNPEEGDGDNCPTRKNGFFYMGNQHNQVNFAEELEALRKDSWRSSTSSKQSITHDDRVDALRKASSVSECYYDLPSAAHETDATPHINLGRDYQARVKKWSDREITQEERDAIEDRDDMVFDTNVIDHLSTEQLEAYELLACSQAVPRPGRNKEPALHLLMENKGNIEAAVMDLLRSDTLDWEQYRILYDSYYPDTTLWTPEEILSFQDAIYKTEKDFHQVAQELTNKTVKECVEFYYTWKKACPDDYRKLRNLRRKRQLLEMHQQMEERDVVPPPAKRKRSNEVEMESECDTDVTASPSFSIPDTHQESRSRVNSFLAQSPSSISSVPRKNSGLQITPSQGLIGVTPSLSPTLRDLTGLQHKYQPLQPRHQVGSSNHSSSGKKGAQPSADGFFHCRLCDKCFEKVKSLNAHMKSHAMKARAEAEAQAQVQAQVNAQLVAQQQNVLHQQQQHQQAQAQAAQNQQQQQHQQMMDQLQGLTQPSALAGASTNGLGLAGTLPTTAAGMLAQNLAQNLQQQCLALGNGALQGLTATQAALVGQQLGLAHPMPQHPALQSQPFTSIIH